MFSISRAPHCQHQRTFLQHVQLKLLGTLFGDKLFTHVTFALSPSQSKNNWVHKHLRKEESRANLEAGSQLSDPSKAREATQFWNGFLMAAWFIIQFYARQTLLLHNAPKVRVAREKKG